MMTGRPDKQTKGGSTIVIKRLFTPRNLLILLLIVAIFVVSGLLGLLNMPAPFVSLAAEPVLHIGPIEITNALLTAWLVMLFLTVVSWLATRRIPSDLDKASGEELVPSGCRTSWRW
jgi:hypothetical protein